MIEHAEVDQIVVGAATTALKGIRLSKVYSEPMVDSEGQEALRVTIIVKSNEQTEMTGDMALDAIVGIQQALQKSGDQRFPIVDFVDENELDMNDET